MTARSVWELLLLRSWRWDRCCPTLPCLWWFLICEGSPADTRTKETNYEFSSNFWKGLQGYGSVAEVLYPRKPISKMSKKGFARCWMDVAVSLLVKLCCFLLRELTFCTAHRKFGNLACELFPFSELASKFQLLLLWPLEQSEQSYCYYHCLVMRYS